MGLLVSDRVLRQNLLEWREYAKGRFLEEMMKQGRVAELPMTVEVQREYLQRAMMYTVQMKTLYVGKRKAARMNGVMNA